MLHSQKTITHYAIKIVGFCVFMMLIFLSLQETFRSKTEHGQKWNNVYYGEKLDIVFMGSSHSYCTFNPVWMGKKLKDFKGLNLSSPDQSIVQTYYNLVELLKYQKPHYIFLEVRSLFTPIEKTKRGFIYENLDGMKFSWNKINSIFSTIESDYYVDALFPLVREHANWKDPKLLIKNAKKDGRAFTPNLGFRAMNGKKTSKKVFDRAVQKRRIRKGTLVENPKNEEYLLQFIELCQKNNIQIVFLKSPTLQTKYLYQKINNFVYKYAEAYKIPYFNLEYDFDKFDFDHTDFYDKGHLTEKAAKRVCSYFAYLLHKDMGMAMFEEALQSHEAEWSNKYKHSNALYKPKKSQKR